MNGVSLYPVSPMQSKLRPFWAIVIGLQSFISSPVNAGLTLSVSQLGSDVRVLGSGSANTSSLISEGHRNDWTNVLTDSQIYAGPDAFSDGSVSLWSGLSGPLLFGNDAAVTENPSSGTGALFGIVADNGTGSNILVLPSGYVSGTALNGSSLFADRTLTGLGFTAGQRTVWNWGSGSNADWLEVVVDGSGPAPVSAPAPAAFTGVVFAFHSFSRLRRRSRSYRR